MEKSPSYVIYDEEGILIGHLTITHIKEYDMKIGRLHKSNRSLKPPIFNSYPIHADDYNIAQELLGVGGYFKKFNLMKELI